MTKDEALKMAIEALEISDKALNEFFEGLAKLGVPKSILKLDTPTNLIPAINACKEALEQPAQEPVKSKVNKYLGLVNLESEFPLTEWERKEIIKYSMECLLEEGELGKLGMLCHKFEETVRYFENKNPVKEFLNNKELYTHPAQPLSDDEIIEKARQIMEARLFREYEQALKEKNG